MLILKEFMHFNNLILYRWHQGLCRDRARRLPRRKLVGKRFPMTTEWSCRRDDDSGRDDEKAWNAQGPPAKKMDPWMEAKPPEAHNDAVADPE